jgi:hypothetical protein
MRFSCVLATGLLLAACGGDDGGGSNGATWDDTVATFANARCDWNNTCDGRSDATCANETIGVLTSQTKPELSEAEITQCIACLQAYTDAYDADTDPCVTTATSSQAQAIQAACGPDPCIDVHDLPGSELPAGG